jgi:hypothetical protein
LGAPPRWAKLIAELRKVRADLADEDRTALDAAITVLLRVDERVAPTLPTVTCGRPTP